jgi:hypothetical protein
LEWIACTNAQFVLKWISQLQERAESERKDGSFGSFERH